MNSFVLWQHPLALGHCWCSVDGLLSNITWNYLAFYTLLQGCYVWRVTSLVFALIKTIVAIESVHYSWQDKSIVRKRNGRFLLDATWVEFSMRPLRNGHIGSPLLQRYLLSRVHPKKKKTKKGVKRKRDYLYVFFLYKWDFNFKTHN